MSCESIQHRHYVFTAETLPHFNRQALSRTDIDHGERAKPESIGQLIGHKVQRPCVIGFGHRWPVDSSHPGFPPRPLTQRQAFFTIPPLHQCLAHGPAFPIQQHPNLPIAILDPCLSHLPHPLPESGTGIAMTAISICGPRTADGLAGAPLTDVIGGLQIRDHHPLSRRP